MVENATADEEEAETRFATIGGKKRVIRTRVFYR